MVIASRNRGKVEEFARLLRPTGWRTLPLDEAANGAGVRWVEDGATYTANAEIKAVAVANATGQPALGDDSGIEIPALGGWPGLRTARWLGEGASAAELRRGLLARVAALPEGARSAVFVCALSLAEPVPGEPPRVTTVEARLDGQILTEERGTGGFGYDPVFVPQGLGRTMAEMSEEEKDARSHRGLAVALLLLRLGLPTPPSATSVDPA